MSKHLLNRIIESAYSSKDIANLNEVIYQLTGIRSYFLTLKDKDEFLKKQKQPEINLQRRSDKQYGDFQTSQEFAAKVCSILLQKGIDPSIVIEPTSGVGNFIVAALRAFKGISRVVGVEVQEEYVRSSKALLLEEFLNDSFERIDIEIIHDDIFTHNFDEALFGNENEILIMGNPPWVTNSELGGKNLPEKSNFKKTSGLDAITGKANFDISEYIILHLLNQFRNCSGKLALLCKTQVVKNILSFLPATDFTPSNLEMLTFDAKKEFNASVDACLFIADLHSIIADRHCKVYDINNSSNVIRRFGWVEDKFVSDIGKYERTGLIDGTSPLVWRSGIKHDCSKVMELEVSSDNTLRNGLGEIVSVEQDLVYPLLKSSQVKGLVIKDTHKRVIVTQKKPGHDTSYIGRKYPLLWKYLMSHKDLLDKRKSTIYRKNPPFSIFGVGEYSFSPYKIAISGLYKNPDFSLVTPINNKPVMLDDSCYLLGLSSQKRALILLALLNSDLVRNFLESVAFIDAKRPYTKNILMRMDLLQVAVSIGFGGINSYLLSNSLNGINENDYEEFKDFLANANHQSEQSSQMLIPFARVTT